MSRLGQIRHATARLVREPERIAPARQRAGARIATSVAEAALLVVARRLARRLLSSPRA